MSNQLPVMPSDTETIAELRELYREAEARAARLRLLHVTGQHLAGADAETLEQVLQDCVSRIAFFVGCKAGSLVATEEPDSIPIPAPGNHDEVIGAIKIEGRPSLDSIPDSEDRETVRMQIDMMGGAISRIQQEREKSHLLLELKNRERRLETLLEWIFTAQEDERRRVSHELHDGVAQTATALVRMLESAEAGNASALGKDGIGHADVARSLVSELRRVIAGLRPTSLDDLGLIPALRTLIEGLEAKGFTVTERLGADSVRLPAVVENALYRVAQEAIANIDKHAGGPCDVIIEAQFSAEDEVNFLRVIDLGSGPSNATRAVPAGSGTNVGIEVMKERMTAIGGTLEWRAGRERGVVVEARLPKAY